MEKRPTLNHYLKYFLLCVSLLILVGCGTDKAVRDVRDQIDSIGTVTLESEELIESAEASYNLLTEEQKGKVENADTLKKARIDLDNLKEEKLEKECLNDIAAGLELGWDAKQKKTTTNDEYIEKMKVSLNAELENARKYEQTTFANEDFSDTLMKFIDALEHMEKGIDGYGNDAQLYNLEYIDNGYKVRANCLAKWQATYGLAVDEKYKENLIEDADADTAIKMAEPGEFISVSCKLGDAAIKIEDIEANGEWTNMGLNTGEITDSQKILILKMVVENRSYADEWNPGFMSLDNFFWLTDMEDVTITPMSSSWEYPGYDDAPGAFFAIRQKETKKVIIPYVVDKDCTEVMLHTTHDLLFLTISDN